TTRSVSGSSYIHTYVCMSVYTIQYQNVVVQVVSASYPHPYAYIHSSATVHDRVFRNTGLLPPHHPYDGRPGRLYLPSLPLPTTAPSQMKLEKYVLYLIYHTIP